MGISGLLPLLKSIQRPCHLKKFSGQTLGVDAYVWLHRGAIAAAVDLALEKPTRRFVDFTMGRIKMLLHFGIRPYLVFDGDYLPSKATTEDDRASRRKESKRVGLELLKLGRPTQAHLELRGAVDVTPEMAKQLIDELKRANIEYVVAPYEADAQLAYLERKGFISGIISEDSDLLVFGAKTLITKLDQYGECVVINRDDFTACRDVSFVGWTDADFRRMAILSGCDYLSSINKMGLKTAHRLLRKHKTVERLLRIVQFDGQFTVPPSYLASFYQAEQTFLYQWVYCPTAKALVNLTPPPPEVSVKELAFIGSYVEPEMARRLAAGDLHPVTKQPMISSTPFKHPGRAMSLSSGKQQVDTTTDLKRSKPIESFFKPFRQPLAELDPNSFTPSPSQERLLEQSPVSWAARSAPTRSVSAAMAPAAERIAPPNTSARAVSNPSLRRTVTAPPSKRARLCSNEQPDLNDDCGEGDKSFSRFFARNDVDPSPSLKKGSRNGRRNQADFDLWSDESLDAALAELPEHRHESISTASKKISVFRESHKPTREGKTSTGGKGLSQTPDVSSTPSLKSRSDSRKPAPRKSAIDAPASDVRLSNATFTGSLSEEFNFLRSKFSYQPSAGEEAKDGGKSQFTLVSQSSRTTTAATPRHSKTAAGSKRQAPLGSETYNNRIPLASPPPPAEEADSPSPTLCPPPLPVFNPEDSGIVIDDSAWETAATAEKGKKDVLVPGSDDDDDDGQPPSPVNLPSIQVRRNSNDTIIRGSEDLLVPESEAENEHDDEIFPVKAPRLKIDLGRFKFGAVCR